MTDSSNSIWIANPPGVTDLLNEDEIARWLSAQWAGNPGKAGQGWTEEGDGAHWELSPRVYHRFQKTTAAILGSARFKTCEIFASQLTANPAPQMEIQYRAGAYRRLASKSGNRPAQSVKTRRPQDGDSNYHPSSEQRGVATLSALGGRFEKFLRGGEPLDDFVDRAKSYREYNSSSSSSNRTNQFIDYKVIATIIAMLAYLGPTENDARAELLWDSARELVFDKLGDGIFDKISRLPLRCVRLALSALIRARDAGLILEQEDVNSSAVRDTIVTTAERLLKIDSSIKNADMLAAIAKLEVAWTLWSRLSNDSETVCANLRKSLNYLPTDVTRFLCEGRSRAYSPWLQSATLAVNPRGSAVLHPDLDTLIKRGENRRNKWVDVITKDAYERAAHDLLAAGDNLPHLKSMLLIPFRGQFHDHEISGFVRLMNRMRENSKIYNYPGDVLNDEEQALAGAVGKVISAELSKPALFGLPP